MRPKKKQPRRDAGAAGSRRCSQAANSCFGDVPRVEVPGGREHGGRRRRRRGARRFEKKDSTTSEKLTAKRTSLSYEDAKLTECKKKG